MKKILKLTAVALLATSTSLMAQMAGPSVAVSLSAAKAATDGTSTSGNNNNTSASISRTFRIASLDLDYAQKINNDWGMSYGINYIPFKGKIADVSRSDTNLGANGAGSTSGTATAKGELKKHFTVYVEPTYMLNKDSGIYAKLGYVHADLEINSTTVIAGGTTAADTVKIHGVQYGIGYKTALSNNLYGKIEASVNNYNDVSYTKVGEETNTFTANPEVKQVTISVGYTF